MNKILLFMAAAAMAMPMPMDAAKSTASKATKAKKEMKAIKTWNHEQIAEVVTRVNTYWQANNNSTNTHRYIPITIILSNQATT